MDHAAPGIGGELALTGLSALVIAATLLFLNLDGYHNEFPLLDSFNEEPPNINWTHGWPLRFMGRPSVYLRSSGISAPTPLVLRDPGNDLGISSRWPFDDVPITYFYPKPLAVDVAFFLILCIGTAWSIYRIASRLRVRVRFGLKFLLALMTLTALILTFRLPSSVPRQIPQFASFAIIGLALLTMLYALVDFAVVRIRTAMK